MGSTSEGPADYKWQPLIKVDPSNKTVLLLASFDNGLHGANPKVMDYKDNAGVMQFSHEYESNTTKYLLDLNQMKISVTHYFLEPGVSIKTQVQASCRHLKKMPEMIAN